MSVFSMHGASAPPVVTSSTTTNNHTWTTTSSQQQAWSSQNTSNITASINKQGPGMLSGNTESAMKPTRPSPAQVSSTKSMTSGTTSFQQPAKGLSPAQLLEFVGLPTNFAEHLTPQNYEQKRRVRQKTMMPPVMPVPTSKHGRQQTLQSSQVRNNNVNRNCAPAPVVPKPAAPLPANLLIEGLPGDAESNSRTTSTSLRSVHRTPVLTTASETGPRSILASHGTSSVNSSVKRMTLKDYKSREEVVKDFISTNCSNLSLYNPLPKPKTEDNFLVTSNVNSMPDKSSNDAITIQDSQTKDGFVIPNETNIPGSSTVSAINNMPVSEIIGHHISISDNDNNTAPETDKDGFVIPNASHIPDHNILAKHTMAKPEEHDESSNSEEELVIDECATTEAPDEPASILSTTSDEVPDESKKPEEEEYEIKSARDISEIGLELDELYQSLTTDGSLLMDKKMRKKVKKLLRRQKRREKRSSMSADEDSVELYPDVIHNRHCADDVDDLECSSSDDENTNEENNGEPKKFNSLKHENIVRKYRQRELEEDKRIMKKMSVQRSLSDGELSEGELSSEDEQTKQPEASEPLYSNISDSSWVDEMPGSPNELQITFTVQTTSPSMSIKVKRVATVAERAGGFKGLEKQDDALLDILKQMNTSKVVDGNKQVDHPQDGSMDIIEIYDKESFLENGDLEDKEILSEEEEGLLSDSDEEEFDNGKWHRRSRSSRHRKHRKRRRKHRSHSHSPHRSSREHKKHSKSRSPSPIEHYKEKRHRERKSSPNRSPSPKRRHRSHSKSPKRRKRTRSRSRSPSKRRRSRSRSPSRGDTDEHHWHGRRTRSRSQSDPHSPPRPDNTDSNNDNKSSRKKRNPEVIGEPPDNRNRSSATERNNNQDRHKSSSSQDCNLEEYNMEISSGNETPPPAPTMIANGPEASEDAEVNRQLEEAMEKLKKMEHDVSRRQVMIEELESKSQNSQASDDDTRPTIPVEHDVTVVENPPREDMDDQLLDAVHRLQRMEENYSRRQLLLDTLRKTMLETEKEFKAAQPDLIEVEDDEEDSPDYVEEIPVDDPRTTNSPHGEPSTSGWQAAPPNPSPSKSLQPVKFKIRSTSTSTLSNKSNSNPPPKEAPPKGSQWGIKSKKFAKSTVTKPPEKVESTIKSKSVKRNKTASISGGASIHHPGSSRSQQRGTQPNPHHASMPTEVVRTPQHAIRSPQPIPSLLGTPPRQAPPSYGPRQGLLPNSHQPLAQVGGGNPGLLGQHPMMRHQAGIHQQQVRQVPPQVPSPARPSINPSSQQQVWLVGSSVLCQAARYVAQGPVGLGLMLNQAELIWHGHDNLKWSEFGQLLSQLIMTSTPPSVLLVHMDALELATTSFQVLAQQAVESLLEFDRRNPNCRIIWSETLPCFHYPGSIAQMTMEQVRINYNVMCSKLVLSLGGQVIKHSDIRPETPALFDKDRMHLSDLGNNIFLNNLRRGLAYLLCEPDTKIYCASDTRTF